MDKKHILSVFLPIRKDFLNFCNRYTCSLIHIEFGFESNYFNTNIGNDFISMIKIKCCTNNIYQFEKSLYKGCNSLNVCFIEDYVYNYGMTPFDLRYRFVTLNKTLANDNMKFMFLKDNDSYIDFPYDTTIYFNNSNGRLGLICDIQSIQTKNEQINLMFIFDRCCLIVRDIVKMVDGYVCDSNTIIHNLRCT